MPTLWIRERGSCPAPSQAPAVPVTSSAQHGERVVLWKSAAPFGSTAPSCAVPFHIPSLHRVSAQAPPAPHSAELSNPNPAHATAGTKVSGVTVQSDPFFPDSKQWPPDLCLLCWRRRNRGDFQCFHHRSAGSAQPWRAIPSSLPGEVMEWWTSLCISSSTFWLCLELQLCNPSTGKGLWMCLTWAAAGPGNLLTAGDDDWAKAKMICSPRVRSWAFSLGRGVWGVILTGELSRLVADTEKMEVVPHSRAF